MQASITILKSAECPQPAALYTAHTLRNKVRKQFQTLAKDSLPGFRDALLECINSLSTFRPIAVQLCIALSALVLQWTDWQVLAYVGE